MWSVSPKNSKNGHSWHSCKPWEKYKAALGTEEVLITEDYVTAFGVFKAVSLTDAGTIPIVSPKPGGSIAITDILISATKVNASTCEILFDDDVNSETLFLANMTNGELFYSHTVKGRMQGWKDARLDLTTVNGSDVYVTIGFVHLPDGLEYSEWNDLR